METQSVTPQQPTNSAAWADPNHNLHGAFLYLNEKVELASGDKWEWKFDFKEGLENPEFERGFYWIHLKGKNLTRGYSACLHLTTSATSAVEVKDAMEKLGFPHSMTLCIEDFGPVA